MSRSAPSMKPGPGSSTSSGKRTDEPRRARMIETISIGRRYNGPPGTANGGYSAGTVAALLTAAPGAATRVTLRRPPPLDTEMSVRHADAGIAVYDGERLVAEAEPDALDETDIVAPVGYDEAVAASATYSGFTQHPFPTCFVCGPQREPGDGLRLFPGRLHDHNRTAAPFEAPAEISPVLLWATLDCPGGWAVPLEARSYVLGRMTARVAALPMPGDRCVVMGEMLSEEGRRAFVRTTVYSPSGGV